MWVCQKIGYCTPNFQSSITIFPIWRAAFSRIPIEMSLSKIVVSQNLLTYWFVIMFPFKLLEWIHYFQRNPKIISVVGYIISIYPRRSPLNHGLIRKKTFPNDFLIIFTPKQQRPLSARPFVWPDRVWLRACSTVSKICTVVSSEAVAKHLSRNCETSKRLNLDSTSWFDHQILEV
jgi:hypothetical protein